MSGVLCAGIRNVFEGGQKHIHDSDGLQGKDPTQEFTRALATRHAVQHVTAICDFPGKLVASLRLTGCRSIYINKKPLVQLDVFGTGMRPMLTTIHAQDRLGCGTIPYLGF